MQNLGEQKPVTASQAESLPGVLSQHPPLWWRDLDYNYMPDKRESWMSTTWDIARYWALRGRTRSPTVRSFGRSLYQHLCKAQWAPFALHGLVTFVAWIRATSPRTCCRAPPGMWYTHPIGRPCLRYTDSCKGDLQSAHVNFPMHLGGHSIRSLWVKACREIGSDQGRGDSEWTLDTEVTEGEDITPRDATMFLCDHCNKGCHFRIGMFSHHRVCSRRVCLHIGVHNPSSQETDGGQWWWVVYIVLMGEETLDNGFPS